MRARQFRVGLIGAVVATMATTSNARAQDTPGVAIDPLASRVGRILGVFDETGRPLSGADVVDLIGGGTVRTTSSGLVGMGVLSSRHDSAVVGVRKIGFADTTVLVMVGVRDTVPMQVFLRRATALEQVTITANETEHLPFYLKDFEERLKDARWSGAKTFTPAELRKNDGLRLFDVLYASHVGTGSRRCLVVYRDGVPWIPPDVEKGSAGVPKEDVDRFDGAVYYTMAQMPLEIPHMWFEPDRENGFRPAPICGALLLYSRHKI